MASGLKVLVVEDDNKIAELISGYLKRDDFRVSLLKRGDTVVSEVRVDPPDLILLDITLPGKDGITICREIRAFSTVPILMLSAKAGEIDRLTGFEAGADDYICKPFSPMELIARIKAVLRRSNPAELEDRLVAGPIMVKPDSHTVTVGGNDLRLTPNEFELLKVLISRPGNVFERRDLVNKIEGCNSDIYERTIDTHIKNLRKKIGAFLPGQKTIQTVYGMGYSFKVPELETVSAE